MFVSGVLEANFIEPAHDKQDFERSPLFHRLEMRLKQMQLEYWCVLLFNLLSNFKGYVIIFEGVGILLTITADNWCCSALAFAYLHLMWY